MTKTTKRVIAFVITVIMLMGVLPVTAFAAIPNWEENNVVFEGTSFGTNGYYNVISKKDYVLVPGAAVESEMVLNNSTGTRRQVLHIIEVDPSNPDVSIVPGYYQIDKDLENEANWSHKELTEMAKYYEDTLGYNIVGGMNTDLYYNSYSPRVLVYNGNWIGNAHENVATGGAVLNATSSILYVFKDAEGNVSCDVKGYNKAEVDAYLEAGTLLHAVGVSFGMVVKDGKLVNTTEKRGLIGIAIGTLVAMGYQMTWMAFYNSKNLLKWPFSNFLKHIGVDVLTVLIAVVATSWIKLGDINYLGWFIMAIKVAPIVLLTVVTMAFIFYPKKVIYIYKHIIRRK